MTQSRYEELFSATPATRAKRTGLQRNALISLLMRRDPRLLSAIDTCKAEAIPMILATIDQIERHSDFMTIKNLPR
ncbi:MAG: hypothetical protein NT027_00430 [Proteobacteria bacterium]|nr:hypothetical protein [Pseudomonadota bacterium]